MQSYLKQWEKVIRVKADENKLQQPDLDLLTLNFILPYQTYSTENDQWMTCLEYAIETQQSVLCSHCVKVFTEYLTEPPMIDDNQPQNVKDHLFACLDKAIYKINQIDDTSNVSELLSCYWPLFTHEYKNHLGQTTYMRAFQKCQTDSTSALINHMLNEVQYGYECTNHLNEQDNQKRNLLFYFINNRSCRKNAKMFKKSWDNLIQCLDSMCVTVRDNAGENSYFYLAKHNLLDIINHELHKLDQAYDEEVYVAASPVYHEQVEIFKRLGKNKNILHVVSEFSSLRQIHELMHPALFQELLHERLNNSNCLHLACANKLDTNCQCSDDCDKKPAQCNIDFILEHIVSGDCPYQEHCFQLHSKNNNMKNCIEIRQDTMDLEEAIEEFQMLSLRRSLEILDSCTIVDIKEANKYIDRKFGDSYEFMDASVEEKERLTALNVCEAVFNTNDVNLLKNFVSSRFFEYTLDAKFLQENSTNLSKTRYLKNLLKSHVNRISRSKFYEERTIEYNLIHLTVRAQRFKLTEVLLLVEQVDFIPNCIRVILECQHMKMTDKIENDNIDQLQDYCLQLLENALNELYREVGNEERVLIFQYLSGTMPMIHGDNPRNLKDDETCKQHSQCQNQDTGPLYHTFSAAQKEEAMSILKMIENLIILSNIHKSDADSTKFRRMLSFPCFVALQQWLWDNGDSLERNKNEKKNTQKRALKCCKLNGAHQDDEIIELPLVNPLDVSMNKQESPKPPRFKGQNKHFICRVLFDGIFLTIFTFYLLVDLGENGPWHNPWQNVTLSDLFDETDRQAKYKVLIDIQISTAFLFELLLFVYLVGVFVEIIRQWLWARKKSKELEQSVNISGIMVGRTLWVADVIFVLTFLMWVILRISFYVSSAENPDVVRLSYVGKEPVITWNSTFWTRLFAAFAYVAVCFRQMHHACMLYKPLGVLYITFQELIIQDVMPFMFLLAVNILSYGVFINVLLHPGGISFFHNGTVKYHKWMNIANAYARPLFVAFGEYQMDDLQKCHNLDNLNDPSIPGRSSDNINSVDECTHPLGTVIYAYVVIFYFIIIVNLTLFNLLIARFSLTVNKYNQEAMNIYYWQLYQHYKDAKVRGIATASPINLLHLIKQLLTYCKCRCTCKKTNQDNATVRNMFRNNSSKYYRKKSVPNIEMKSQISDSYRKYLIYQAKSFSGKRIDFCEPIYKEEEDIGVVAKKLQGFFGSAINNSDNLNIKSLHQKLETLDEKMNQKSNVGPGKFFDGNTMSMKNEYSDYQVNKEDRLKTKSLESKINSCADQVKTVEQRLKILDTKFEKKMKSIEMMLETIIEARTVEENKDKEKNKKHEVNNKIEATQEKEKKNKIEYTQGNEENKKIEDTQGNEEIKEIEDTQENEENKKIEDTRGNEKNKEIEENKEIEDTQGNEENIQIEEIYGESNAKKN